MAIPQKVKNRTIVWYCNLTLGIYKIKKKLKSGFQRVPELPCSLKYYSQ